MPGGDGRGLLVLNGFDTTTSPDCSASSPAIDLGPDGETVDETIEHLRQLAVLGVQVAHGTLIGAGSLRPLEMMAERVIPSVSDL